jgi:glycosyltransferase involved in cell wall biosynthesis
MNIFFLAGKCLPIHAYSLDERPLGGTETSIIRVADFLQKAGHEVTVFSSHRSPPESSPKYRSVADISTAEPADILIAVQDWWPLFWPIKASRRMFWTGDGAEQYLTYGLGDKRVQKQIDLLLVASNWHAQHLCEESGFPISRTVSVGCGVNLDWFGGGEQRNRKRLIYTSTPYRGLELVPSLYLELKKKHPDLELRVFSGLSVYDTDTKFSGLRKQQFDDLLPIIKSLPDCQYFGNILQQDLARELMRSGLYFYPNTWRETACICCIEAKAAGCPIVTTNYGALSETVGKGGIVIDSQPEH